MEAATRNPDSATPLPLFRPEALAARNNFHGEALFIRPFSWVFLCCLAACITAATVGFLLVAHYTPTAKVLGKISSAQAIRAAGEQQLEASFYLDRNRAFRVQSGTRVLLRCSGCSKPSAISGVVMGVTTVSPSDSAVSTNLARTGPVREVTVALPPLNPALASRNGFAPGTILEAEFPLARRPLIDWLIRRPAFTKAGKS